jgi:hypothetical protein
MDNEEILIWNINHKLDFEDFNGPIPNTKNTMKVFEIQEGIFCNLKKRGNKTEFFLATMMSKNRSYALPLKGWYHPDRKELEFEWGNIYMNLLEIETRKLRKMIINENIIITDITELYEQGRKRLDFHSKRYDTIISKYENRYYNQEVINEVNNLIDKELEDLKIYDFNSNTFMDKEFMKKNNYAQQ